MKERIYELMSESLGELASGRKKGKAEEEREAVLANSRVSPQPSSCLARLTQEFPLLDHLLLDADLHPDQHSPSPSPSPPEHLPSHHPSRIDRLKTVYGGYWPGHDDPR